MNTTNQMVNTAKKILTGLTSVKVSTGVTVEIGKKGEPLKSITMLTPWRGYDDVRKSINSATDKYYEEDCIVKIGDNSITFKGGKFSNELLKMLEKTTVEYFNNGDFLNKDENFKSKLAVVKLAFLNENITIVDLLPIAAEFQGLSKKNIALLAEALSNHDLFVDHIEQVIEGLRLIREANEAEKLALENGKTLNTIENVTTEETEK